MLDLKRITEIIHQATTATMIPPNNLKQEVSSAIRQILGMQLSLNLVSRPSSHNLTNRAATTLQWGEFYFEIASRFRSNPKVLFGIMNEPHDMPTSLVLKNNQVWCCCPHVLPVN